MSKKLAITYSSNVAHILPPIVTKLAWLSPVIVRFFKVLHSLKVVWFEWDLEEEMWTVKKGVVLPSPTGHFCRLFFQNRFQLVKYRIKVMQETTLET